MIIDWPEWSFELSEHVPDWEAWGKLEETHKSLMAHLVLNVEPNYGAQLLNRFVYASEGLRLTNDEVESRRLEFGIHQRELGYKVAHDRAKRRLSRLDGVGAWFIDVAKLYAELNAELPEGFPHTRKSKREQVTPKSQKFLEWQKLVDEAYSKNNRLSHVAISIKLASKLGIAPDYLRRYTKNPKNK